ncbi:MAG: glycosyltransferase family 1 protein [Marinoscillum sp.]
MRIGIEAQRIFRKKKHGMDIYALELIRQLQQEDHVNEYIIFVKPGEDKCLEETANFKIVEVRGFTYADWEQISLPTVAAQYDLDVLHCTSNTAPLLTNIPLYLTVHDIIYLNQSFSGGSWYQRLGHSYRKWIVPHVFKRAMKVFTVSEFEKTKIDKQFGDSGKVEVVYNGVAGHFKEPTNTEIDEVRALFNLPERFIFFLGNTAPKKNMIGMLEAYGHYRNNDEHSLPLVIAESSPEDLQKMLERINRPDLARHIYLTGYVDHQHLPTLYGMAELFVYPSLRESFGIPIIEAMACGTPVITSNTSSMPEVAGDYAMLIDPTKPLELGEKMATFLKTDCHYKSFVASEGLIRASKFTWQETAKAMLQSYSGAEIEQLVLA